MSGFLAASLLSMSGVLASDRVEWRVDPGSPTAPDRFATVDEAIARLRERPPGSAAVRLVLVDGFHVVHHGLDLTGLDGLELVGEGKAALIGGHRDAEPAWRAPDARSLARLPGSARERVRAWELPRESVARFTGGLAGPSHAGHAVDVAAGPSDLIVGGRPLTLARWPNVGLARIDGLVDAGSAPRMAEDDMPEAERRVEPDRGGTFRLDDRERLERWAAAPETWLRGFWNWDWSDEQLPVARIDAAAGTITLARPHRYGLAARGMFQAVGLPEELDEPGEFWIDREAATVLAWLPDGDVRTEAMVSLLDAPMITIGGARSVTIRGLAFTASRGPAIVARDVEGIRIERCEFRSLGTSAVRIDGRDSVVAECGFTDVGGLGVALSGGDRATLSPGNLAVESCTFRRCGRLERTYRPAIELDGVGHRVGRCLIEDVPHFAIRFRGNDHRIEANEIARAVGETGDAGAIYVGRDWTAQGTVIRGNLFRDIAGTEARFQNAVYLDDMASGITVEDNVFLRCNLGVLVGGGRDVRLARNAFLSCGKAVSWDARGVAWMAPHLADPGRSTILKAFRLMPVATPPWSERYPRLAAYATDRFGRPVGGELLDSTLVGSPLGRVDDRECVREDGTRLVKISADGLAQLEAEVVDASRRGPFTIGATVLGPVGPRPRE